MLILKLDYVSGYIFIVFMAKDFSTVKKRDTREASRSVFTVLK